MQKILSLSVAGTALIAAGCTTAAMANDDTVARENIEVIVQNTGTTGQSVIIHGVNTEVRDGEVIITGDTVRTTADGRVIISGGQADILPAGARHLVFRGSDGEHAMRLAEASAALEHLDGMRFEFDEIRSEEMERVLERVEVELENLHGQGMVVINGERREMTDAEREDVRRELVHAREEIRTSLPAAAGKLREALRDVHVELERAQQELANAESEVRRVHVIARHDLDRAEPLSRELREGGARQLRFVSEDGEERIWVDGEELEAEARTEWLNRLETGRLEGGGESEPRRIVIEIDRDESE